MSDAPNDPRGRFGRFIPSPAMAVACCALVVAATGAGVAASGAINGASIRNGTIVGAKLKNNTVTANKLAKHLLKRYPVEVDASDEGFYFTWSSLTDPTKNATAHVLQNGTVAGAVNASVTHPGPGVFCVAITGHTVDRSVTSTDSATATLDYAQDDTGLPTRTIGQVFSLVELQSSPVQGECANDFEVRTFVLATIPTATNGPVKGLTPAGPVNGASKRH
jgi:hypothetical protein